MSQFVDGNVKAFTAGAAIGIHVLVKIASGKLAVAGLGDEYIGSMTQASFADGDVVGVRLKSAAGTHKLVAAGAFAQGARVYSRAAGEVDDVSTGAKGCGIALEAAAAADDVVEVVMDDGEL